LQISTNHVFKKKTVGRMVGVAAIGDAWLIEPPGGFWPKPGRSAVSGGNRVRVPAGRVITNKQTKKKFKFFFYKLKKNVKFF
jgi:hypothetical protein